MIAGNICCFIASGLLVVMGLLKKKPLFLGAQCGASIFFVIGCSLLGGTSGVITNGLVLFRNLYTFKWKASKPFKAAFIVILVAATALFKITAVVAWLPVIATCVFTWFMDSDDMVLLKILHIITQILFVIYDISIKDFGSLPFAAFNIAFNIITAIQLFKTAKNDTEISK